MSSIYTARTAGSHKRAVLTTRDHYVRVRLVVVVVELGKPEFFHLSLAPASATQKRVPPGLSRRDLLQVLRPEQSMLPLGEAYVHGPVDFAAIATYDLADQASSLRYPVVLLDLHSHAHACILRLHDYQRV